MNDGGELGWQFEWISMCSRVTLYLRVEGKRGKAVSRRGWRMKAPAAKPMPHRQRRPNTPAARAALNAPQSLSGGREGKGVPRKPADQWTVVRRLGQKSGYREESWLPSPARPQSLPPPSPQPHPAASAAPPASLDSRPRALPSPSIPRAIVTR